jgi:hypothetical protein
MHCCIVMGDGISGLNRKREMIPITLKSTPNPWLMLYIV